MDRRSTWLAAAGGFTIAALLFSGLSNGPQKNLAKKKHIRALNHVSRETYHVEEMAKFYTDVLDFERIPRPDFGFGVQASNFY